MGNKLCWARTTGDEAKTGRLAVVSSEYAGFWPEEVFAAIILDVSHVYKLTRVKQGTPCMIIDGSMCYTNCHGKQIYHRVICGDKIGYIYGLHLTYLPRHNNKKKKNLP